MWMKLIIYIHYIQMNDVKTDKFTNVFNSFNIRFSDITDLEQF